MAVGMAVVLLAGCASAPGDGTRGSGTVMHYGTYVPLRGSDPGSGDPSRGAPSLRPASSTAPLPEQKVPPAAVAPD